MWLKWVGNKFWLHSKMNKPHGGRKPRRKTDRIRNRVSKEAFAEIWHTSSSVREVAKRTGYKEGRCRQKASEMRKQGWDLAMKKDNSMRDSDMINYIASLVTTRR